MSRDDRVHSASSADNTARPAGSGNTQQCAPLFGGRERFNVKKKPLVGTLSPGSSCGHAQQGPGGQQRTPRVTLVSMPQAACF